MADRLGKKARVLYVLRYLSELTDDSVGLSEKEITAKLLDEYGIEGDRRQLYDDIATLELCGYKIERSGKPQKYRLVEREFSLPELKLLVDAVQSSRFITVEKSSELIGKLETLCSRREGRELSRSVHVQNRIKAMNESIYSNVDAIESAITLGRQIEFHYFKWNAKREKELRHGGKLYAVSPLALTWTDENYYMIAWDDSAENQKMRHYRVDKMLDIKITELPRLGTDSFNRADMGIYTNRHFGMFGGEDTAVRLECDNSLAGVIIDRFGLEPTFFKAGDNSFYVTVNLAVSDQFFGWLAGLGQHVKIISPEKIAKDYADYLTGIAKLYEK